MSDALAATEYKMIVNGRKVDAENGETYESVNPATGETIGIVPKGSAADVDKAVRAAHDAFHREWKNTTAATRASVLRNVAQLIMENAQEFAELESRDNGKPVMETQIFDIPASAEVFEFFASAAYSTEGDVIPVSGPVELLNYTRREPYGVCAQITPWNFPLWMACMKIAPALAAGNTVVLKPATWTPLTTLRLGELFSKAGAPSGTVNILTGPGGGMGSALVEHPLVEKVAFTGSTEVGTQIMSAAAKTIKDISLELGGKNPNIVFADCDVDNALNWTLLAAFFNQGQMCTAGSRLLVQDSIYDEFLEKLVERAGRIRVGDPMDMDFNMGALVHPDHRKDVEKHIERAKKEGAKLLCGGGRPEGLDQGCFLLPAIFGDVTPEMSLWKEEVFGPVLGATKFSDLDEAVALANDTRYGLAAGIHTNDLRTAHQCAHRVQAGKIWVNCYNMMPAEAPFGGYKQSGIGRELGRQCLSMYTQVKNVAVSLSPPEMAMTLYE